MKIQCFSISSCYFNPADIFSSTPDAHLYVLFSSNFMHIYFLIQRALDATLINNLHFFFLVYEESIEEGEREIFKKYIFFSYACRKFLMTHIYVYFFHGRKEVRE